MMIQAVGPDKAGTKTGGRRRSPDLGKAPVAAYSNCIEPDPVRCVSRRAGPPATTTEPEPATPILADLVA
ncbi:hypothetical protein GCM10011289_32700 [Paludibacterium paludis]|uniref:Uncharacterized protein n=1 Tax=Paludibacterium paludis TaxID=1225769 RepID=A0A918UBN1_9NEIS|nr:hypothetical protein GCM10011289_32700 [Paludibacterium paludis]